MSSETPLPILRDYTDIRDMLESFSGAPQRAGTAVSTLADSSYRQVDQSAFRQGLVDSYTLFPNPTPLPPIDAQPAEPSRADGKSRIATNTPSRFSYLPNPRAVPHNLAARSANRPNDGKLAIISEQDSRSTLGLHGTPLRGRYPFLHLNDKKVHSPISATRGRCKGRHDLVHVSEDTGCTQMADVPHDSLPDSDERRRTTEGDLATVVQANLDPNYLKSVQLSVPAIKSNDEEDNGPKKFVQSIVHAVRGASRRLTMANAPYLEVHDRRSVAADKEGSGLQPYPEVIAPKQKKENCPQTRAANKGPCLTSPPPHERHQARGRHAKRSSRATLKTSAHTEQPPVVHLPPVSNRPGDELISDVCRKVSLPWSQVSSLATERPLPQNGESRGVASNHVVSSTPEPPTRGREDSAIRYTFDGVPLFRNNAPSLHEYDCARDADTSLCSTNSTSYSGTVLGIDLDLQLDYPPRRSPTPTWFTPRETSKSEQQSPPRGVQKQAPQAAPPRSITSSALPILLPLAAASGIVRPNHATPQLSFYSPSGNLIQADDAFPPTPPPASSSYYQTTYTTAGDARGIGPEPLARPVLLPATTPPSIPLPRHLQQGQHHHHAHSHIVPQTVVPSTVKGCDGVVRARSLQPRSGVRRGRESLKSSHSLSSRLSEQDGSRSCCSLPQRVRRPGPSRWSKRARRAAIGPLAGWTLRVCFCQPFDGAGEADTACLGPGAGEDHRRPHSRVENVRVVDHAKPRKLVKKNSGRRDSGIVV
ncbi:hypothetical protein BDV96DRAFT_51413 [Lophiotrema nucula]|uniref:Uncharacterized protein n=1 Tax=Lophiotrema nucula TaxID=690887 RepID=A0A6A5ZA97_9PLEO|nr:hypothetical protein BDV96DRAFT_51413 [Lophiotrema nucula]